MQTPESVPRLFDLVSVKSEKIKVAFYFGLRDCLLANDLDQAIRIAYAHRHYKTYKVVTLNGVLIQESGTISGGGGKPRHGRLQLKNNYERRIIKTEHVQFELKQLSLCAEIVKYKLSKNLTRKTALCNFISKIEGSKNKMFTFELHFIKECQKYYDKASNVREQLKLVFQNLRLVDYANISCRTITQLKFNEKAISKIMGNIFEGQKVIERKRSLIEQKLYSRIGSSLLGQLLKLNTILMAWKSKRRFTDYNPVKCYRMPRFQHLIFNRYCHKHHLTNFYKSGDQLLTRMVIKLKYEYSQDQEVSSTRRLIEILRLNIMLTKTIITNVHNKIQEYLKIISTLNQNFRIFYRNIVAFDLKVSDNSHYNYIDLELQINKTNSPKNLIFRKLENAKPTFLLFSMCGSFTKIDLNYVTNTIFELDLNAEQKEEIGVDVCSTANYYKVLADYFCKSYELQSLVRLRNHIVLKLESREKLRAREFCTGLHEISFCLKEIYYSLTSGGNAELELVDCSNPFESGVIFSVRPPGKTWKSISNLSGGEKTISSLSLVFALHFHRPSSFFIMDEIDSALDFKNATIVSRYIKTLAHQAQFILISLRTELIMFALRLIGIYKSNNHSHSVLIQSMKLFR
eukprot:gnl/MRDRNA2_/MRDRNA2_86644_c0_seq1.p2 gnl/MRDRNA2_/MRDRNA2_86644_c0~~gnl/MRDRNA2_/MRDRNA2_86644_c0_seq1.p2  ORF type:complete len:629 (+),score=-11.54 gnl/MRDRNA2_/MRDRNA2_86644_c0_seq1:1930-3816(+)